MFERFTKRGRKVMSLANEQARRFGHKQIGTEYILLGLLTEGAGTGVTILKKRGVDIDGMLAEVEQIRTLKSGSQTPGEGEVPGTPHAVKVIEYAIEEARALNHDHIGTEHLLLGLLRETDGVAAQVLANLGVKLEDVRSDLA